MNLYIVTDTHLGHDAIIEHCKRPKDHEERIIRNIKSVARDCTEGIFLHLGDVAWSRYEYWHRTITDAMMHHKKWLIRGNHDKQSIVWLCSKGWDFAADAIIIKMYGKRILFTHEPAEDGDYFDINIHGHLHNTGHHPAVLTVKHILVHMEDTFMPVRLDSLI